MVQDHHEVEWGMVASRSFVQCRGWQVSRSFPKLGVTCRGSLEQGL